jgi:predicted ATP-grasp superfamily ATP-dependent carboligase
MKNPLRILLIDDDVVPLTRVVIQSLGIGYRSAEIYILCLHSTKSLSYRYSRYVKNVYCMDASDDYEILENVIKTIRITGAEIIIPIKEKTVRIVSEHLDTLQGMVRMPPMPDAGILNMVRNKWLLYNWLFKRNHTSHIPLKFNEAKDFIKFQGRIDFPVLIKPFWGSGGRGIHMIHNKDDFIAFKPDKSFNIDELLVQPFIPGYDIDISVLAILGRILCYTIQKGHSEENKMVYAKKIEFVHNKGLYDKASLILDELNFSGIAHLDFRFNISSKQYELIDFNARYWSTLLGSLNAGINFPWIACECAKGNEINSIEFKDGIYYAVTNPFKLIFKIASYKKSELQYIILDPIPYFFDSYLKLIRAIIGAIKRIF